MSKGVFQSHNKENKVFTYYTNASSATTFNPSFFRNLFQKSLHIDYGDNSSYDTGLSFSKVYSDGGTLKKVKIIGDTFTDVYFITSNSDLIVGNVDLSPLEFLTGVSLNFNPQLTGVTYPNITSSVDLNNCGLIGNHDMSNVNLNSIFLAHSNGNLTGITHSYTYNNISYIVHSCNLLGNYNLSMFPGLGGSFLIYNNFNLTGITHTTSTQNFGSYWAYNCNLTGTHNVSMLSGLGGTFDLRNNPLLTKILHTASTQTFYTYRADSCNLIGNHDVSMFPNLGGLFRVSQNTNLTGITHTTSTLPFIVYDVGSCNLTGTYDMRMFPGLGGSFNLGNNNNLTSILHTGSTQNFTSYALGLCNITGIHDVSMLSGLGGNFSIYINNNLTSINFPYTTKTFKNIASDPPNSAFAMYACTSLGYVDFKPLSGITMDVNSTYGASIYLDGNGMSTTNINHILYDFSGITSNNLNRWSGVTLDISGNSAPDTSTGGYDGISSINYLTGATANWTIIL
jgi:hypothetical protein